MPVLIEMKVISSDALKMFFFTWTLKGSYHYLIMSLLLSV